MALENIHSVKRKEQDINQIQTEKKKPGCKTVGQFFKKLLSKE